MVESIKEVCIWERERETGREVILVASYDAGTLGSRCQSLWALSETF